LRASLAKSSRLIHWVARTDDIVAAQAKAPDILGPIVAASRRTPNWKITIRYSCALPGDGAYPTLTVRQSGDNIVNKMVDCGRSLLELTVAHPETTSN
jgi:hypothetical protein